MEQFEEQLEKMRLLDKSNHEQAATLEEFRRNAATEIEILKSQIDSLQYQLRTLTQM